MEFSELIKKRRACHHFIPGKAISKEDLLKMVEEAGLSPSGYNAQPWEFILVTEQERISKIQEIAFDQDHVKDASCVAIILADTFIGRNVDQLLEDWLEHGYCTPEEIPAYKNSIAKNRSFDKRKQMALRNTMLACMTFMLSAENLGYATCPLMGFSQWQLEEYLKVPDDRVVALMVAIGYEDEGKEKTRLPRKNTENIIHWEEFGEES